MIWTVRMIDHLERGIHAGKSYEQIAREIGQGLTRNACIGKAHRLGIRREKDPAVFVVGLCGEGIFFHENRTRAQQVALHRLNAEHGPRRLMHKGVPRFTADEVEAMTHRVALRDLPKWTFE